MKLGVLMTVGLGLVGASLVGVLAGENEFASGKATRPSLQASRQDEFRFLASGAAGGPLFEMLAVETNRAPKRLHVVPRSPLSSAPLPGGGLWVLTNSPALGTNVWVYRGRQRPDTFSRNPSAPMVTPPGVYVSEPYKSLVVVPGPQPDDRCLITGGEFGDPMPIYRPYLRLVPRGK